MIKYRIWRLFDLRVEWAPGRGVGRDAEVKVGRSARSGKSKKSAALIRPNIQDSR